MFVLLSQCCMAQDEHRGSDYNQSPTTNPANSTPVESPTGQQQADNGQNKEAEQNNYRHDGISYSDIINIVSTAVIAAFTVVLAIYTVKLWRSGEKHSERDLRAYISVAGANIQKSPLLDRINARVQIRNSGRTPAYAVRRSINIIIGPPATTEFPVLEWNDASIPLGPNETYWLEKLREISNEERINVTVGSWGVYVFGRIEYRDAFESEQWVRFRLYFNSNAEDMVANVPLLLEPTGDSEANDMS